MNPHALGLALARYDRGVDDAFRRWLRAALPPALRTVAVMLPHRIGLARRRWQTWHDVFRSPVMRSLPGAVAEAFPLRPAARLYGLGLAHVLLAFVVFIDDRLNDGQTSFARDLYLVRRSMEVEAGARLTELLGADARFWRSAERAFQQYAAAHAREPRLWTSATAYSHRRYARDAADKIAVAQLPALAVARVGGASAAQVEQLRRAFDHCLIALQYLDDVNDWIDDFRARRWTYFVRRHLHDQELRANPPPALASMHDRIATASVTEEFLARARQHLSAASDLLATFSLPTLSAWVAERSAAIDRRLCAPQRAWRTALRRAWTS